VALNLKKPSTFAEYSHVYSQDPAIDADSESYDHAKWVESGSPEFLPLKPGQKPTEFRLRHLTAKEHARLADMVQIDGMVTAATEAFQLCCTKISDMDFRAPMSDDVLSSIYYHPEFPPGAIVIEVGARAISEAAPKKH
jgi:hypothetical protein